MGLIAKKITDKRILKLLRSFLNSGIMEEGIVSPRTEGSPQGSPLSPLLSNIVLNELDKELSSRGHRFVRYADDCSIYVRSEKSATRVKETITEYIEPVSYTHLDVYKRQILLQSLFVLLGYIVHMGIIL